MKTLLFATPLFLFLAITGAAQKPLAKKKMAAPVPETALYKEIFIADSAMFFAFNNCDSTGYKNYLTTDLEFYHDLGGLHYLAEEMQSVREICTRQSHIRRQLLKRSLEVYPLGSDGAVEIGIHRIYHTNPGQMEHLSGEYKFIHVWQKAEGGWKLKRVISYGHNGMNNN